MLKKFILALSVLAALATGSAFAQDNSANQQLATAVARKLIAFDDETLAALTQLGRDRMATLQDLADEAFADLLKKHGVPVDLKDALRKSARLGAQSGKPAERRGTPAKASGKSKPD